MGPLLGELIMRTGVIAKKMGMTRLFQDDGRHVPVTVLSLEQCQVVARRDSEKDGYVALQLGAGAAKPKTVATPQAGDRTSVVRGKSVSVRVVLGCGQSIKK